MGPQTVGPDPEGPNMLNVAVPVNCCRGRRPVLAARAHSTMASSSSIADILF